MEDFKHLSSYELLGVSHDAPLDEIKRAYRQQIARYHPDHYSNASPDEQAYASERTQHINQAYDSLVELRKRTAASRERIEQARNTQESSAAGTRDYQAELYEQACEHLNAGRFVQATATLRELQQLNPFYRDSASLLARAKAGMEDKTSSRQPHANDAPSSQRRRVPLIIASLGVLAVVGIAAVFFVLPQFQAKSANNTEPTALPTAMLPTQAVANPPADTPIPNQQPTPETAPAQDDPNATTANGTLLTSYDFTSGDTWANQRGDGWAVGVENGAYRISMQPGNGSLWSYQTSPQGTEYRVQTDMQVSDGGAAGLVAHVVDEQNYIALLIDPTQSTYQLLHYQQGTATILAKNQSPLLHTGEGATNRLELLLEGKLVQVFINATPVTIHHIESLIPTNKYGLIAAASDAVTIAQFDNLEIRTVR
jgi:curved DNA-binding protein CbpA